MARQHGTGWHRRDIGGGKEGRPSLSSGWLMALDDDDDDDDDLKQH